MGKNPNEGARLLCEALAQEGMTSSGLAESLGLPSALVVRWMYCDRKPGRENAVKLRNQLSIPIEAWDIKPTEPIVFPAGPAKAPPRVAGGAR